MRIPILHTLNRGAKRCRSSSVPRSRPRRRAAVRAKTAWMVVVALLSLSAATAHARTPSPRIQVLSNRADLVSGGDALVRVTVPRGAHAARLRLTAGGRDVTSVLQPSGKRTLDGVVDGLRVGRTPLVARI